MQRNVATLGRAGRVELVGPVYGEVASGERGVGRMAEPAADCGRGVLARSPPRDLEGLRIVSPRARRSRTSIPCASSATGRPERWASPWRSAAAARGAEVTLIAGPVSRSTPLGVRRVDVRGALAMRGALWQAIGADLARADALIMTAAVADYRPRRAARDQAEADAAIARRSRSCRTPICSRRSAPRALGAERPVLVGFAVETDTDERVIAVCPAQAREQARRHVVANHAATRSAGTTTARRW